MTTVSRRTTTSMEMVVNFPCMVNSLRSSSLLGMHLSWVLSTDHSNHFTPRAWKINLYHIESVIKRIIFFFIKPLIPEMKLIACIYNSPVLLQHLCLSFPWSSKVRHNTVYSLWWKCYYYFNLLSFALRQPSPSVHWDTENSPLSSRDLRQTIKESEQKKKEREKLSIKN